MEIKDEIPEAPLYSLNKLKEIGRGDQTFIRKMLSLFIQQIPAGVIEIKAAQRSGNFAVIKATAHRIKPILNNFCIGSLTEKIKEIECLAAENKPSGRLEELIGNLEEITSNVISDISSKSKGI